MELVSRHLWTAVKYCVAAQGVTTLIKSPRHSPYYEPPAASAWWNLTESPSPPSGSCTHPPPCCAKLGRGVCFFFFLVQEQPICASLFQRLHNEYFRFDHEGVVQSRSNIVFILFLQGPLLLPEKGEAPFWRVPFKHWHRTSYSAVFKFRSVVFANIVRIRYCDRCS